MARLEAALVAIDGIKDLEGAISKPGEFFTALDEAESNAARLMMIARLRPILQPLLRKHKGFTWEALVGALEGFKPKDLREILDDPEKFLARLSESRRASDEGGDNGDAQMAVGVAQSGEMASDIAPASSGGDATEVDPQAATSSQLGASGGTDDNGGGGEGGGGGGFDVGLDMGAVGRVTR